MNKRRVVILFGGRSGEHEVSIVSASQVRQALDPETNDVALIGITKTGEWVQFPTNEPLQSLDDSSKQFRQALIGPSQTGDQQLSMEANSPIDIVIPVLHGPYGEDGTVQGLLELAGLPYVGCGVLASATAMDKAVSKRLLHDVGIPVVAGQLVLATQLTDEREAVLDRLERTLQYPMFVKPANLGSSVGVTKAADREGLTTSLAVAAGYDRRILVESAVPNAREIEVAVLGNDDVRVSVPGEIIPDREFYDYESKYGDESGSQAVIPADLAPEMIEKIQDYAERAFRAIDGAGLARVDFLLNSQTGELFVNEINTFPGFTPISMYPKLWEASGISYGELLNELIRLGQERSRQKQLLKTSRD